MAAFPELNRLFFFMVFILFVVFLLALGFFFFRKKKKNIIESGTITLCTGAVKTGKSTLAVYLAFRAYRRALIKWFIACKILFRHREKPLLYSNIPLKGKYVPLTTDILLRKVRINYGSVVLLDEASLIADSQLIKDHKINKQLLKFFKLFGHYSKGGTLIIDTQSISDLHYAIKRCLNSFVYLYSTFKYLPFFLKMKVLEQRYSDDGSIISAETTDISDRLKTLFVPKRIWKKFDCYCYSILTDDKPRYNFVIDNKEADSLKSINIPSFRDWSDDDKED